MHKLALTLVALLISSTFVCAGTEYSGNETKQVVPPPCPEWYGDTEWNVSLWGTYAFTAEDWESDRYIDADHAWGGGIDAKFFFHRYFGIGVQGWAAEANRNVLDISGTGTADNVISITTDNSHHDTRAVGSVLGTVTLRYPFHCSRFAPYVWGGVGAMFGGGERDILVTTSPLLLGSFATRHTGSDTELVGQVGAGFEFRLTRHIGLINDFAWNFVARDNSDFGMVRAGLNFAF